MLLCMAVQAQPQIQATETTSGRIIYWAFTEVNGFPEVPTDKMLADDLAPHRVPTRATLDAYGKSITDPRGLVNWPAVSVCTDNAGTMWIKCFSMGPMELVPGTIEALSGQMIPTEFVSVYKVFPDGKGSWGGSWIGSAKYYLENGTNVPKFISKVVAQNV